MSGNGWQLRRIGPAVAAFAAATVIVAAVIGSGSRHHHETTAVGGTAARPSPSRSPATTLSPSGTPSLSKPIRARRLAPTSGADILPVGAPVPSSEVAHPVRLHGRVLVGLGAKGALFQTVYPVRSTDDGGHWQISGPRMYRAGASAPAVADHIGALPDGTTYIWGKFGNFIRVAQDGKSPWYAANLPPVTRVWDKGNTLLAHTYAEQHTTRIFRSTDDGRSWTQP